MNALLLQNGNILVPQTVQEDGMVGDMVVELPPDHPEAVAWINWYNRTNREMPREDPKQTRGVKRKAFDTRQKSLRGKRKSLTVPHVKMGFTGTIKDKIGRTRCYSDGVMIDCPRKGPEPDKRKKKGPEEQPNQKKPQPQLPQQPQGREKAPTPQLKPSKLAEKKGVVNEKQANQQGKVVLDKKLTAQGQKVMKDFAKGLQNSQISVEKRVEYFNSLQKVVKNMPEKALERLSAGTSAPPVFYENFEQLGDGLVKRLWGTKQAAEFLKAKGRVSGCYVSAIGELHLDGGTKLPSAVRDNRSNSYQIYSHEMSHAIDGKKGGKLTDSAEWQKAFQQELTGGKLNQYASTNKSEGFAEFGRLLYSGDHDLKEVKKQFPECYAFWEKNGLVKDYDYELSGKDVIKEAQPAPPTERTRRQISDDIQRTIKEWYDAINDPSSSPQTIDPIATKLEEFKKEGRDFDKKPKQETQSRTREQIVNDILVNNRPTTRLGPKERHENSQRLQQELRDFDKKTPRQDSQSKKTPQEQAKKFNVDRHESLKALKDAGKLFIEDEGALETHSSLRDLARVPKHIIDTLVSRGLGGVYAGRKPITELDNMKYLKGVRPRGWSEGKTWDNVGGCYDRGTKTVVAGWTRNDGSVSTSLHELGHAVGDLMDFDDHPELKFQHETVYNHLKSYFKQGGPGGKAGMEEFFAETFAQVLVDRSQAIQAAGLGMVEWIETEVLKIESPPRPAPEQESHERAQVTEW